MALILNNLAIRLNVRLDVNPIKFILTNIYRSMILIEAIEFGYIL